IAAEKAASVFSQRARLRSCRPRWAIGRAVSQARSGIKVLLGFYDGFDFHRRVHGQDRNPDRRPGMFTTLAQGGNQEIGSAIGHEMLFYIIGSRSDENGYLDDAAQIAEAAKGVAYLRKHIRS